MNDLRHQLETYIQQHDQDPDHGVADGWDGRCHTCGGCWVCRHPLPDPSLAPTVSVDEKGRRLLSVWHEADEEMQRLILDAQHWDRMELARLNDLRSTAAQQLARHLFTEITIQGVSDQT